jgi:hypothetical protein
MMAISHRLVGYDPASGWVAVEHEIPESRLDYAKRVAGIGADDPEAALCYKLTDKQTRDIAGAIGAHVDAQALNFYMEGFAGPAQFRPAELSE